MPSEKKRIIMRAEVVIVVSAAVIKFSLIFFKGEV